MKIKNAYPIVTKLLLLLGFLPKHTGFSYIREMIVMSTENSRCKLGYMYLTISSKFGQPVEAVKTAVRLSLQHSQSQNGFSEIEKLVGVNFLDKNYNLSPSEFVSLITEYLTNIWDGETAFI